MSTQSIHFVLHCPPKCPPKCPSKHIFCPKKHFFYPSKTKKRLPTVQKNNRKPFNYCSINVLAIKNHLFFVAFDRISSPLIIHAFLFSTTPPLLNSTRSSEHCFTYIFSRQNAIYSRNGAHKMQ